MAAGALPLQSTAGRMHQLACPGAARLRPLNVLHGLSALPVCQILPSARSAQHSHRVGQRLPVPQALLARRIKAISTQGGLEEQWEEPAVVYSNDPLLPLAHYHTMGDILRLEVAPPHVRTEDAERYWENERQLHNMYVEYTAARQIVAIGLMLPLMCLSHAGWEQLPFSSHPAYPDEPTIFEAAVASYNATDDLLTITLVGASDVARTHSINHLDLIEDRILVGKDAADKVTAIYIKQASTSVAGFQATPQVGAAAGGGC